MKVILATSNKGKVDEIKEILKINAVGYEEILGKIKIEETGKNFKENALIKAKTVFKYLRLEKLEKDFIVLADDSGLCIEALGGAPGIFSARFAGKNNSDEDNIQKVITLLKKKNIEKSFAYFVCAIAICSYLGEYTMHGFLFGNVIDSPKGNRGFGYDPIFIPRNFTKTLGEISVQTKNKLSHRKKALDIAMVILHLLMKNT
jgi:XTP/dITP diphosphohydrolase